MNIFEIVVIGDVPSLTNFMVEKNPGFEDKKTARELKIEFSQYSEKFSGLDENLELTPLDFLFTIDSDLYHRLFDEYESACTMIDDVNAQFNQVTESMIPLLLKIGAELWGNTNTVYAD